jgi:potassium uptake TrkH family protein
MFSFFTDFGDRYFKQTANLVFTFGIFILLGQIIVTGFNSKQIQDFYILYKPINLIFSILCVLMSFYLFLSTKNIYIKVARFSFFLISICYFFIALIWILNLFHSDFDVEGLRLFLAVFIGFMAVSFKIASLGNTDIHPALLFILSFVFVILFGAFCLMLPAAANKSVTFLQALFTSTSAVTVTGLAVLDTGKDFTIFGQSIIMLLLQIGGLGILTITNIFALLFKSSSTFKNRMMVSDMIKEMNNNNTFSTLFKIIMITILVETIGAILIFIAISGKPNITNNPIFFASFHSISAFCNGGFSTLSNSLYEESVRFNYFFHITIAWLIITGGLGYSVIINHYYLLKNFVLSKISCIPALGIKYKKEQVRSTMNSKLVLITTIILLVAGTLLFMVAEYNGVLREHGFFGKIIVSFFNSTTPRTAGFNNIKMEDMGIPAFMLVMALMWVGASPGSTGGGIKTTTFVVGLLNLWNQIRGRENIVIKNREIPSSAINQVNAVILLSIFAISFGTFLISFMNPEKLFKDILFECISAYSTVGLSVSLTPSLSEGAHIVLICLMFLGRVSFLTFLIGVFSQMFNDQPGTKPYYPKENVFIN